MRIVPQVGKEMDVLFALYLRMSGRYKGAHHEDELGCLITSSGVNLLNLMDRIISVNIQIAKSGFTQRDYAMC